MTAGRIFTATAVFIYLVAAANAAEAPPGASSCTGCHAANAGPAMRPLSGMPQNEIADAMTAFKSGKRPATIMDRIAKGFTDEEIRALAAWYAAQK